MTNNTQKQAHDPVNRPSHYTGHPSGIECIQITEHMGFNLGNALKYIWRCDLKQNAREDLKKAIWYIERELAKREQTDTVDVGVDIQDEKVCASFVVTNPNPRGFKNTINNDTIFKINPLKTEETTEHPFSEMGKIIENIRNMFDNMGYNDHEIFVGSEFNDDDCVGIIHFYYEFVNYLTIRVFSNKTIQLLNSSHHKILEYNDLGIDSTRGIVYEFCLNHFIWINENKILSKDKLYRMAKDYAFEKMNSINM